MTSREILAERFEANRTHLHSVAMRILNSRSEADDAVQEAFLRLARADPASIDNVTGWLTTVVARICLDTLRARRVRREVPVDAGVENLPAAEDAEHDTLMADSVGVAMLVVLETLMPAERVAFVLHDVFNIAFDDIASVIGRSAAAARQLASRGRRRVQGVPAVPEGDRTRQREVVGAFLAASRGGDFSALLALLDPDVALQADESAVRVTAALASRDIPALQPEIRGRDAVAKIFNGRAKIAQLALVDGDPGLVFAPGGRLRTVVDFVIEDGRIAEISMIADPERIAALDLEF